MYSARGVVAATLVSESAPRCSVSQKQMCFLTFVKDRHTENDTFADALTRALKPRVPWWLRLRIRIDQNTIEVRHRVLIRVSSGRCPRFR
jgi:hypothetical protein